MDIDALKKLTVADLKEQAKKIPDVKGLSAMKKDELIELILEHEGAGETAPQAAKAAETTDTDRAAQSSTQSSTQSSKTKTKTKTAKSARQSAPAQQKGPLDKSGIKQLIRALKQEKKDAISQQDHAKASQCNRQIHDFKRRLRKMAGGKKQKQKQ
jgi:hypothetical protein